jgi:hypothetical protein
VRARYKFKSSFYSIFYHHINMYTAHSNKSHLFPHFYSPLILPSVSLSLCLSLHTHKIYFLHLFIPHPSFKIIPHTITPRITILHHFSFYYPQLARRSNLEALIVSTRSYMILCSIHTHTIIIFMLSALQMSTHKKKLFFFHSTLPDDGVGFFYFMYNFYFILF